MAAHFSKPLRQATYAPKSNPIPLSTAWAVIATRRFTVRPTITSPGLLMRSIRVSK